MGEDDGQHITLDTKIIFEWLHVRKRDGDPHVCQISYRHLISLGRPIPNSPMLLQGRPGLLYTLDFFDNFAANICRGLRFCGLMHEGSNLCLERCLPAGGIDVLDRSVYWQLPNGLVRCASARALRRERCTEAQDSVTIAGRRVCWLASSLRSQAAHWLAVWLASSLER